MSIPTEKFRIATRITGRSYGERRTSGTGESIEFHDFREYEPGDEPRAMDWRTYARTGRLYTRLYSNERTVHTHVVIDSSASMRLQGKADRARDLAELIARIALQEMSVQFHTFAGARSPIASRMRELPALTTVLTEDAESVPESSLLPTVALRQFARYISARPGRSLVVIISDFLDPHALTPSLLQLRLGGTDVIALQLLAEAEWNPNPSTAELVDVETNDRLNVDPSEYDRYRQEIRTFVAHRRKEIRASGGRHVLLPFAADGARSEMLALLQAGIISPR